MSPKTLRSHSSFSARASSRFPPGLQELGACRKAPAAESRRNSVEVNSRPSRSRSCLGTGGWGEGWWVGLPRGQGTQDAEAAAQKEQRAAQPGSTLPSKHRRPRPRPQGMAEPPLQSPLRCHLGAKRAGGRGEWASEIIIISRFCRGS